MNHPQLKLSERRQTDKIVPDKACFGGVVGQQLDSYPKGTSQGPRVKEIIGALSIQAAEN